MRLKFNLLNCFLKVNVGRNDIRYYSLLNNTPSKENANWKTELENTMQIIPNFVTVEEEKSLLEEVDPHIRRLPYEQSHWDDAIHSYREMERYEWNHQNEKIICKIKEKAFPKGLSLLPLVHVLDLAAEGWIKPHVDSIRFCGEIIAGLSLLTDCIMRLRMVDNEKLYKDFLLPQRSLYIMSGSARYDYNHEILKTDESYFKGEHVVKGRRISIICRSQPNQES